LDTRYCAGAVACIAIGFGDCQRGATAVAADALTSGLVCGPGAEGRLAQPAKINPQASMLAPASFLNSLFTTLALHGNVKAPPRRAAPSTGSP
jgi:hypothetical protein